MKKLFMFFGITQLLLFPGLLFAQTAKVIDVQGQVLVKEEAASSAWGKAKINMFLKKDAEIQTKAGARCTLAFDEEQKNILTVQENTIIKLENIKPGNIFLPEGRVFSLIKNLSKAEKFQIRTPTAIAGARGTIWATGFQGGLTNVACFSETAFVDGVDASGNVTGEQDLPCGFSVGVGEGGVFGDISPLSDADNRQGSEFIQYSSGLGTGAGQEGGAQGEDQAGDEQPGTEQDAFQGLQQEQQGDLGDTSAMERREEAETPEPKLNEGCHGYNCKG
ncbi:MAG: hypothetical protein AUJ74_04410 [Candidatus Omnitrophica bacterium CG1_02_44_16]|nr:MAG: hypothetical protein AUJ74_04410 [Candidatus Omnitrophica bacterium CG1_02_44_16]PIY82982.1 MAG: hypothetical protein COY78_03915 [Candidatus Omnitrophica bacterium CG_4_10_14_0_8_um_filter_44_12]PIZ85090.1 MAG: hypothetical protein COX96_00405 [Candidatus Omnitrophica bacterium CG_4_10_14_0_2_um_filter_44_9]